MAEPEVTREEAANRLWVLEHSGRADSEEVPALRTVVALYDERDDARSVLRQNQEAITLGKAENATLRECKDRLLTGWIPHPDGSARWVYDHDVNHRGAGKTHERMTPAQAAVMAR